MADLHEDACSPADVICSDRLETGPGDGDEAVNLAAKQEAPGGRGNTRPAPTAERTSGQEQTRSGVGIKRPRSCIVLVTPTGSTASSDNGGNWSPGLSGSPRACSDDEQTAIIDRRSAAMRAITDIEETLGSPPSEGEKDAILVKIKVWMDVLQEYIKLPDDTMAVARAHLDKFLSIRQTTPPRDYALFALGALYKASSEVGHPEHVGEVGDDASYEFEMYAGGSWPAADIEAAAEEIGRYLHAAGTLTASERHNEATIAALRGAVDGLWKEVSAQTMANMAHVTKTLGWSETVLANACEVLGRMERHLAGNGLAWMWTRYGHAALAIAAEDFDRESHQEDIVAKKWKVAKRIAEVTDCDVRELWGLTFDMRRELGLQQES